MSNNPNPQPPTQTQSNPKPPPLNLGHEPFRQKYKQLLELAKNKKKKCDKEWAHKSLCLYHEIYPLAKKYFNQQAIPEELFQSCQCGMQHTVWN